MPEFSMRGKKQSKNPLIGGLFFYITAFFVIPGVGQTSRFVAVWK
jgi:hypothetical protein